MGSRLARTTNATRAFEALTDETDARFGSVSATMPSLPGVSAHHLQIPNIPDSYTTMIDRRTKVTFSAGLVPVQIESLGTSKSPLSIDRVRSTLEVSWLLPSRSVLLHYNNIDHAQEAVLALNGRVSQGVQLTCRLQPSFNLPHATFTAQVDNVTEGFTEHRLLRLLLGELGAPRPSSFCVGQLSYDAEINLFASIEQTIREATTHRMTGSQMMPSDYSLKRKAVFNVEGVQDLSALAHLLDGRYIEEAGDAKISAVERLHATFSLSPEGIRRYEKSIRLLSKRVACEMIVRSHPDSSSGRVRMTLEATSRDSMSEAIGEVYYLVANDMREQFKYLQGEDSAQRRALSKEKLDSLNKTHCPKTRPLGGIAGEHGKPTYRSVLVNNASTETMSKEQQAECAASHKNAEQASCAICWEDIKHDRVTISPCGHVCCESCFYRYCSVDREARFPLRCFEQGVRKVALSAASAQHSPYKYVRASDAACNARSSGITSDRVLAMLGNRLRCLLQQSRRW